VVGHFFSPDSVIVKAADGSPMMFAVGRDGFSQTPADSFWVYYTDDNCTNGPFVLPASGNWKNPLYTVGNAVFGTTGIYGVAYQEGTYCSRRLYAGGPCEPFVWFCQSGPLGGLMTEDLSVYAPPFSLNLK
jgi:hypothetical protein